MPIKLTLKMIIAIAVILFFGITIIRLGERVKKLEAVAVPTVHSSSGELVPLWNIIVSDLTFREILKTK